MFMSPDGGMLHYDLDVLQYSPFESFLIPGIILFIIVGLFSWFVSILTIVNHRCFPTLVIVEACILLLWLILEIIMIRTIHWIFVLYGVIAIVLIIMGIKLKKQKALNAGT